MKREKIYLTHDGRRRAVTCTETLSDAWVALGKPRKFRLGGLGVLLAGPIKKRLAKNLMFVGRDVAPGKISATHCFNRTDTLLSYLGL